MTLYQKLSSLLPSAGLSEAETHVYVELLKDPAQTSWELVQRTALAKSVVYRAIERLSVLKMIEKGKNGLSALSLKSLVAELLTSERNLRKVALKLKDIDPFLTVPRNSIDQFDTLYTPDQIKEAYLFISEQEFDTSLDYGDLDGFLDHTGGLDTALAFERNRMRKGASNHAVLTTSGPHTEYFCQGEVSEEYKHTVNLTKSALGGTFVGFSDKSDYVLFTRFNNEALSGTLIKSKAIADAQRMQFETISQM